MAKTNHSTNGPLRIGNYYTETTKHLRNILEKSTHELGSKLLTDVNSKEQIGFLTAQRTVHQGTRINVAKAFLSVKRPNLHIITKRSCNGGDL